MQMSYGQPDKLVLVSEKKKGCQQSGQPLTFKPQADPANPLQR
jgi:hypothetical protein